MAKEDVPPLPDRPPKKRRQLEQAPDIHLALWANSYHLSLSEKRRVREERERRKRLLTKWERIGILIGDEGVTPTQVVKLSEMLTSHKAVMNEIWLPEVSAHVWRVCKSVGVAVESLRDRDRDTACRTVIRNATKVFAFPNGENGPLWDLIRYARHRNLTVEIIMPNGERR